MVGHLPLVNAFLTKLADIHLIYAILWPFKTWPLDRRRTAS